MLQPKVTVMMRMATASDDEEGDENEAAGCQGKKIHRGWLLAIQLLMQHGLLKSSPPHYSYTR